MTICDRIFQIIDDKQLKTADLARLLNIKQSVLSNWKKRNTDPPMEYTLVICEFLGISVEKLITGKDGNELTTEEQQLLEAYRMAQPAIRYAAKKLLDVPDQEQEELSTSRTG